LACYDFVKSRKRDDNTTFPQGVEWSEDQPGFQEANARIRFDDEAASRYVFELLQAAASGSANVMLFTAPSELIKEVNPGEWSIDDLKILCPEQSAD